MPEPIPSPDKAMYFAELAHSGQRYNEEAPYTVHLKNAVNVAKRFGLNDDAFICAVWLHDSIEDTRTSFSDIKKRFGTEVAELVFAVTNEQGRNREERTRKTYPKTRCAGPSAVALKLVDRIANVEYGLADKTGKAGMYAEEFSSFVNALYLDTDGDAIQAMWKVLARLLNRVSVLEADPLHQKRRHLDEVAEPLAALLGSARTA